MIKKCIAVLFGLAIAGIGVAHAQAFRSTPAPDSLAGWCQPTGVKVGDRFSYLGKYDHAKGENAVHWFKVTRTFETVEAVQAALKSEATSEEDKAAIKLGTAESRDKKKAAVGMFIGLFAEAITEGSYECEDGRMFVLAVPAPTETAK